jgi:hypothetical protein
MTTAHPDDRPDLSLDGLHTATRRSFLAMLAVIITPAASAQDDAKGRDKSALRLETMRRLAREMKVCEITDRKPGPPLALRLEPLLRYNHPGNQLVDGTLWRWGDRGRPAGVLKLGLRGPERGKRSWNFNVAALSPKPIEVDFGDGPRWSSRPPGELQPRTVPEAPAPAGSPAQRLTQARAIARRFSVSLQAPKPGRIQQRLLPQPLDRYGDPEAGLLDGMLFAFVGATNPNVLLILEASSDDAGVRAWRYAFARLSNVEETALLDGKQVWNVPLISTPANAELYMGRSMRAEAAVQD